jgi:hypothetical protein
VIVALVLYIGKESFFQPGMERFEGKYEELGHFRNENNTGPVLRIYAIRTLDEDQTWMKEFAESQPHTKYGKTLVYFFSQDVSGPIELSRTPPYFDQSLDEKVVASFERTPMGEPRFKSRSSK